MLTSTPLSPTQFDDWKKHVVSCFPNEACAYIVNDVIMPVANRSDEPKNKFAVSVMDRFEANKGIISGFLHSHCLTPRQATDHIYPIHWPSTADMHGWMADNTRWGVSGCDGQEVSEPIWLDNNTLAPLEGRPFIHGIWDCYAAMRDWFRVEKNVILPNFARGMEWWMKGQDLYADNFEKVGFVTIDEADVVPGDCGLMKDPRSGIISHIVVITSDNQIFHHAFSRNGQQLSGYADRGRWSRHIDKYIRYTPQH